jgi:hypothetical protein
LYCVEKRAFRRIHLPHLSNWVRKQAARRRARIA